jgi:cell division septation protein DedD
MVLFRSLESKGFRGMLFQSKEDGPVRVMAGPYFDQQSLEKAKSEIETAGFRPLRVW